ncbi:MAG: pyrroloquinoline quinone biosynthesis peptide chaperone PqqD [Aliidongia sp.]
MTAPPDDSTIPTLARGVKFRFDEVRQNWVLLAPERLFVPDDQAVEILKLVDGSRSLGSIVDDLAARFNAPRDLIAGDVAAMLADLAAKGAIRL